MYIWHYLCIFFVCTAVVAAVISPERVADTVEVATATTMQDVQVFDVLFEFFSRSIFLNKWLIDLYDLTSFEGSFHVDLYFLKKWLIDFAAAALTYAGICCSRRTYAGTYGLYMYFEFNFINFYYNFV